MAGPRSLTNAQARRARERYHSGGITQLQLAAEYGVSHTAMQHLVSGQSYRDAGGPIGSLGYPESHAVDVEEARRLREEGWLLRELAERYGVSKSTISARLRYGYRTGRR